MKRREALKTIGGLAGAAGLSRVLPGCGGPNAAGPDAGAPDAAPDAGPDPVGITTYVYMMMENRSYDHWFGARSLLEGKPGNGPRTGVQLPDINGKLVSLFHPDNTDLCDLDPPHGWESLRSSWNKGACDQFLKVHQMEHGSDATALQPLQYLTRNELPVSYALADAYTSCDRWFCSVMGPTWPNRFYWHSGTSFGLMTNDVPTSTTPSIHHRLNAAKVPWRYYYGNVPFLATFISDFDISPYVRSFETFFADAKAGRLPPVVYLDPAFGMNDDHPPVHPVLGQALIAAVYKALAGSPQWKNLLFVLTYDENGGFYDHVSPPTAPDDRAAQGFDQFGFRVPTLVMGPYAKQGVNSTQYDHTSALRHLENTFGLQELTMRTAAANDLSDCIDMQRLAAGNWAPPIELPSVNIDDWPMDPVKCKGSTFREDHPVLTWANTNPMELTPALDLRPQREDYKRAIIEVLNSSRSAVVRTP